MKFHEAESLIYNNSFAKEAWLDGQQVWPPYSNCLTWIKKPLATNAWTDIVYGPVNTLVVTGLNTYSYSTNNGDTWSTPAVINSDIGNEFFNAVAYGNNIWSMVEFTQPAFTSKFFYTSVDVLTGWTKIPFANTTLNPLFSSFSYSEGIFNPYSNKFIFFTDQRNIAGTNCNACVIYSSDGVTWLSGGYFQQDGVPITAPQGFGQRAAIGTNMPNNRMTVCGSAGAHKFAYSDNGGLSWIQGSYNPGAIGQNLQAGHSWSQVDYGFDNNQFLPISGRFVSCCANGDSSTYQFAYSDDGIGWIGVSYKNNPSLSANLAQPWSVITYGNGKFVALSNSGGYQAVSKDGINWTGCQTLPTTTTNTDIVVANNRFVAVVNNEAGNNNAVITNFV